MEWNNLLPKFQSGFRKRHSTETSLLKVMSDILLAADQRHVTLLRLLDMFAAFDTVDHDILLFRLKTSFEVDGNSSVMAWVIPTRSNAAGSFQSFNGQSSALVKVASGLPQGSILGPLSSLLYTADIPSTATKHGIYIHCYTRTMDSCFCLTRRVLQIPSYKVWPIASLRSTTGCLRIDLNSTRTKRNSAGSGQDNSWAKQAHMPSTLDHRQYSCRRMSTTSVS